jgi:hypothetical protein
VRCPAQARRGRSAHGDSAAPPALSLLSLSQRDAALCAAEPGHGERAGEEGAP